MSGMENTTRLHRATRVFLASLLVTFGASAPQVLRQMADELDQLAAEVDAEGLADGRVTPDPPCS